MVLKFFIGSYQLSPSISVRKQARVTTVGQSYQLSPFLPVQRKPATVMLSSLPGFGTKLTMESVTKAKIFYSKRKSTTFTNVPSIWPTVIFKKHNYDNSVICFMVHQAGAIKCGWNCAAMRGESMWKCGLFTPSFENCTPHCWCEERCMASLLVRAEVRARVYQWCFLNITVDQIDVTLVKIVLFLLL